MDEDSIFAAALAKTTQERAAYLDWACAGNVELRRQVEELLAASSEAGSFLNNPVVGTDATVAPTRASGPATAAASLPPLEYCNTPGRIGKLGHYEVIELVGYGGMGAVLRALDTKLNRVVAVKTIAPALAANPGAVKRFLREAKAAAAVHHDNVVTIHAVEDAHQPPYLVMEFIQGETLQQKIERKGALPLIDILRIGSQMAAGLAAAHEQGLIHRDVKPSNILLENGVERVKITDFGLARAADDVEMTQSGLIAGTPQYMSPEQAKGEPIDYRSDLFSLGSVLYTMCTGRPAFRADNTVAILRRVCDDTPRPICDVNQDIPPWLEAIVSKMLSKKPTDRFPTATAVDGLLKECLAHVQNPTHVPAPQAVSEAPLDSTRGAAAGLVGGRPSLSKQRLRRSFKFVGAALGILMLGLLITESTGTTGLRITLVHLITNQGMLHVNVSDSGVNVVANGQEFSIAEPGVTKIPLRAGQFRIAATKDGQQLRVDREVVNITRAGSAFVTVARAVPTRFPPDVVKSPPPRFPPDVVKSLPPGSVAEILASDEWQWSTPENLGQPVNTPWGDNSPTLSGDGLTLIIHSSRPGGLGDSDLWMFSRDTLAASWKGPTNLGPNVNSRNRDAQPALSPDGLLLVFESNRDKSPTQRGTLWVCSRGTAHDPWSPAVRLHDKINFSNWNTGPTLSADKLSFTYLAQDEEAQGFYTTSRATTDEPWSAPRLFRAGRFTCPEIAIDETGLLYCWVINGQPRLQLEVRSRPQAAWSQPVDLTYLVGPGAGSPCLAPDGTYLLYDANRPGGRGGSDIWMVRRVRKSAASPAPPVTIAPALEITPGSSAEILTSDEWEWTEPENLGPIINTARNDGAPSLSGDGLTLLFNSARDGGQGGQDIWFSTRASLEEPWTKPQNLGPVVNTQHAEDHACLSADGLCVLFNSGRPGGFGRSDIWMAKRAGPNLPWSPAENLGKAVNTGERDLNAGLSADGLTLVFQSDRKRPGGRPMDLWMCVRDSVDQPWSPAKMLGPQVNGPEVQAYPALASDSLSLIFNSTRNGPSNAGSPLWICGRASPADPWSAPVRLWPKDDEGAWSPWLSADATTLYFDSKRAGGFGDFDLWMVRRVRKEKSGAKVISLSNP